MKAKAVVTGGAGFIGSHLVLGLRAKGHEVVIADLPHTDIRDTEILKKIFTGARYVFHLAALPRVQFSIEHPQETNEVNVGGTVSVLHAAKEAGVKRVVYAASSAAYGDQREMPLREDMSTQPKSPYGLQKYVGELYCRLFNEVYGLETVSLRYFNVYGPNADPNGPYAQVISKFILQRRNNLSMTVTGDGTQTRDLVYVHDVVKANLLAAESPNVGKGEVINIGGGKNTSVNHIAELIGGPVEHIPPRLEPHDTLADCRRAKELLGWEPEVSLEEGIAELKKLAGLR